jgi:2-polyprenyl-6-methoxyphenol hydroxylase-like FAD-dependent oxidoreductase
VLEECRKVGILDDMRERGLETTAGLQWRNLKHELLSELHGMMGSEGKNKMIFLGQHSLGAIILEHIAKYSNIKVLFGHRFVGVQQNDKEVTALFLTAEGEKFMTADYMVGADGAGSAVRHSLCIPFEGFTWNDFHFIATNMYYDFEKEAGWKYGSLIVDPEHWAVIVRTGAEGTPWRIAYGEPSHLDFSKEAILERLPAKYEKLLPGSKKGYTVENVNPYFAHQRCAKNYRIGRVTLCGDAAHVIPSLVTCSSIGQQPNWWFGSYNWNT